MIEPAQAATCQGQRLGPCARSLQAARDGADKKALRERAASYIALRQAQKGGDGWVQLFGLLTEQRRRLPAAVGAIVVADQAAAARVQAPAAAAKVAVVVQDLAEPAGVSAPDLLVLLAEAAGFQHVIWAHGGLLEQLFPDDPLQPFMVGLPPVIRAEDTLDHLAETIQLAQTLRAAFLAASGFQYVEAAALGDQLAVQAGSEPRPGEPVLRARYALQLLSAAGLLPDREPARPVVEAPPSFAPLRTDTPYGDLLRVRVVNSKSHAAEWGRRRASILGAIAPDRRDDVNDMMMPAPSCRPQRLLPVDSVRDLIFGDRLAGALAMPGSPPKANQLAPTEWRHRYKKFVELTVATGTSWSYLPELLRERGYPAEGFDPQDPTYVQVTELALSHLRACLTLEQSAPLGYQLFTQLALLYSRGVRTDGTVFKALLALGDASLKGRLSPPADAQSLISGVLWSALSGIFYPDDARGSYLRSLHEAVQARLRGDLLQHTGWSVASLYALDEIYRRVAGLPSELAVDTHNFVRALHDPDIAYPELAALAQATVLYSALLINNTMDTALVGDPTRFPSERREAYETLRRALELLGGSGASADGPGLAEDLPLFADGLVAILSASLHSDAGAQSTCSTVAPPPSAPVRAALDKLLVLRQRLLAPATAAKTSTSERRRTRLLMQLLSDLLDLGSRGSEPVRYATSAAVAQNNLREGLQTWPLGAGATLLATGYGVVREYLMPPGDSRKLQLAPEQTQALLRGLQSFITASAAGGTKSQFLTVLAGADWNKVHADTVPQVAAGLAQDLYARQQPLQAGALLLTAAMFEAPEATATRVALRTAERHDRPLATAMQFYIDTLAFKLGRAPEPAAYAATLQRDADELCQGPGTAQVLTLLQAASDFANGRAARARASLHSWLRSAEDDGLVVPRVIYQFEEKMATSTLQLGYTMSYGTGILSGERSYSFGLATSTVPAWESKLTKSYAKTDDAKADTDATRYYIYGASLLTVYELLAGNLVGAEQAAGQALVASEGLARLGKRPEPRGNTNLAFDSRGVLAVAAQLAAEAGMPILAGKLFRQAYDALNENDKDDAVLAMLTPLPTGLAGGAQLGPLVERVRGSLRQLARSLPCRRPGRAAPEPVEVSCQDYPMALALYLGSSAQPQPRLTASSTTACGYWPALDRLQRARSDFSRQRHVLQTAALAEAVPPLLAAHHEVEAAYLLLQRPICDASLFPVERRIASTPTVPASLRQRLLSDTLDCSGAIGGDPQIDADLLQLDAISRKLPGDSLHYHVLRTVLRRTQKSGDWTTLRKLVAEPDFAPRMDPTSVGGSEKTVAALLVQHLAPASAGQPPPVRETAATYKLACQTFAAAATSAVRRGLCVELQRFRPSTAATPSSAELRILATDSLRMLNELLAK